MSESAIQNRIRVAVTNMGGRAFRNNVGVLKDARGNRVAYGLCPGSSDLIGWVPTEITADMVGQTVAVFLAIEVKGERGRATEKQKNFVSAVRSAGGIAGVCRSVEEARRLIEERSRD